MANVKALKDKVVNGGGIFTFLRMSLSSQLASYADIGTRFVAYSFLLMALPEFYRSNLSVALGAIVGGIINCCLNYKYTFHASGQSVRAVGLKYFLVWVGSLLLNMYGTTFLYMLLSKWGWLYSLGFTDKGVFFGSTLLVSLVVSLGWNFVLQRGFVYKPNPFDPYAIRIVNFLTFRHSKQE